MYLSAAAEVFEGNTFSYTKELVEGNSASLEFQLVIDGTEINGVDLITWNDENKIIEFRVFIRPLKGVQIIHEFMGGTLDKIS